MHGSSQAAPVSLNSYGGLVTLADPSSIPEGASPRNYDRDFLVGSTIVRPGLTNAITYADGDPLAAVTGASATDVPRGTVWANPSNVLLNMGVYATTSMGGNTSAVPTVVGSGAAWTNPADVTSPSGYAIQNTGASGFLTCAVASMAIPAGYVVQGIKVDCKAFATQNNVANFYLNVPTLGMSAAKPASLTSDLSSPELGSTTDSWGLALTRALLNGGFSISIETTNPLAQTWINDLVITVYYGQPATDGINIEQFGFSIPATDRPQGFLITVKGFATSAATLNAQLIKAGVVVGALGSVALPIGGVATVTIGGVSDLFGESWLNSDINSPSFGVQLTVTSLVANAVSLGYTTITPYIIPAACNFDFLTTFTQQDGTVKNISLDADGNLWVENVTSAPGVLSLVRTDITPNSYAVGVNGPDVEYLAFNDGFNGSDIPLQYTPKWIDRITQVGPGAAPVFTAQQSSSDMFTIATIDQPAAAEDGYGNPYYGYIYFLQSSGPGSSTPGNVVTVYYSDSTAGVQNADLVAAFNSGYPVYLYLNVYGTPTTYGPYTQQVTSIGEASPPGQPRQFFYFTYIVPSVAYTYYQGSGHSGYQVAFQRTLATMAMVDPVPGLLPGNQVTISGASVASYDAAWTIVQALNSASMVITNTAVASGVATFNYSLSGGSTSAPAAGELITITGTTNAGGALNMANATIASATGGSTGSFTIAVSVADFASTPESAGLGVTAGNLFTFDPGAAVVGTVTNPIYGHSTGGTLVFAGPSGQFISPGTRQGSVFFITRNGYYTAPAPPVTFTCPDNTDHIVANQIPIGPPNVVARAIIFTEAGSNGTPGANFFTLPTQVKYIVNDVTYTADALFINDNVTTSQAFFFTDSVLLNGLAVDVYAYNLFNQIEIGDPAWVASYAGRNWYGKCRNKIQNFVNLSFDGGYLPSTKLKPLGWTQPDAFGQLIVSPKFGNAYYIANNGLTLAIVATAMTAGTATYSYLDPGGSDPAPGDPVTVTGTTNGGGVFNVTAATIATVNAMANTFTVTGLVGTYGSAAEINAQAVVTGTLPTAGLITQTAFQDAYQTAIIQPNVAYSVRIWARIPSGLTTGTLNISLSSGGTVFGNYNLAFSAMTTDYAVYDGPLLTTPLTVVPPDLILSLEAVSLGTGADVEIDRFDVYDTAIPILATTVYGSYAGLPEQVDAVTGQVIFASENQQPVNGAMVMYDTFYALKAWAGTAPGSSLYSLQSSDNLEPAQWAEPEVAQRSGGAIGPMAFDLGEQWLLGASRLGLYLFEGGQPGKIMQEIYQVWDAINWAYGYKIWVRVDLVHRRIFIGVPLPTPNFWLPNAPTNANPTSPNVILMCNYQGLDSGSALKESPQMHTTMFGSLNSIDMRRKWSIWQIASPYAAIAQGSSDEEIYICNGQANSKIYRLDDAAETDDGVIIDTLYTTAGLVESTKRAQMPQVGIARLRWEYLIAQLQTAGNVQCKIYPNILLGPGAEPAAYKTWTVPGGFSPGNPALQDVNCPLNFAAYRAFFEFRENDGHGFSLSNMAARVKADVWNKVTGAK